MASPGRVELPIFPLGRDCSIQLSYGDTNPIVFYHRNGKIRRNQVIPGCSSPARIATQSVAGGSVYPELCRGVERLVRTVN